MLNFLPQGDQELTERIRNMDPKARKIARSIVLTIREPAMQRMKIEAMVDAGHIQEAQELASLLVAILPGIEEHWLLSLRILRLSEKWQELKRSLAMFEFLGFRSQEADELREETAAALGLTVAQIHHATEQLNILLEST